MVESAKSDVPLPHVIDRPKGMPRAGFAGRPRNGQWVIAFGTRVGIHCPPNPGSPAAKELKPGFFVIHFVNTLGLTISHEAVEYTDLEPLLDRRFVPKARLATTDPQWTPRP